LSHIVGVFVNFSQRKEFIDAVAKDGRSYDKKVFETALSIVQHHNLISVDNIERFSKFIEKVEEIARADTLEEEDLGEVPDEFLDPLLFTLMVNPVKLPSSEVVIDLSTIRTHLLSDPHDPFNRQPLKLEDVIPGIITAHCRC
jgi:ubiquitin conjugation factor E4 B